MVPRQVTWNYENVVKYVSDRVGPAHMVRVDYVSTEGYRISVARLDDREDHPQATRFYRYNSHWQSSLEEAAKHFMSSW